jgi:TIR domain
MKERVDDLTVALTHRGAAFSRPLVTETVSLHMLDVFVSHSSQDVALAAQVVDLLRAALNLRAESIRCTSVDGYRLPAGADSDEQLRDEALACRALIGIVSAFSLASAYVLFELGARWGTKRPLIPLLAPGIGPQALKGPLAGLNALSCESTGQLHQLVSDIAAILNIQPANPAVFQRHIEAILYSGHPTDAPAQATAPTVTSHPQASEADVESPPRADDYSDAEQVIKRHCQREWPSDYSMRNYCVKQQRDALAILKRGCPPDIPADVFVNVRARCADEWPDDYSMRAYSEKQQFVAYRELQRDSE